MKIHVESLNRDGEIRKTDHDQDLVIPKQGIHEAVKVAFAQNGFGLHSSGSKKTIEDQLTEKIQETLASSEWSQYYFQQKNEETDHHN